VVNDQPEQLEATEKFLQDQKLSVELIAVAPVSGGAVCLVPLESCRVQPGQTVDLHLLVRNLGVGHSFPGGTIDSNEVWLEVRATDARGRRFYHHGGLSANGDVDPAAHFYKAVLLDRSAQLINKRNVHDWVSTLYARTIPPGASDVARYRVTIPPDVGDRLTIEATLHYRKFFNWFTRFVFAGQRAPNQSARVDQYVDESQWLFTNAPVPSLPVVTVAAGRVAIPVGSSGAAALAPPAWSEEAVQQLNAYGIGLLLQRDTKNAWAVLEAVTARAPQFIEGSINLARTQIAEGSLDQAEQSLRRALEIDPDYPKALYLLGKIKRDDGDYGEALALFQRVAARYPKDRVLCNEIAQLYYLQDRYQEAIAEFQNVLAIDPENLTAHYYLMLSYKAIGEEQKAQQAEARYLRYKPDESTLSLAGQHRLNDPIASLEAQPVHIHE